MIFEYVELIFEVDLGTIEGTNIYTNGIFVKIIHFQYMLAI